jgi:hypothetical protein
MLVVLGPAGGAKRSFTTVMSSIWRKKKRKTRERSMHGGSVQKWSRRRQEAKTIIMP